MEGVVGEENGLIDYRLGSIIIGNELIIRDIPPSTSSELKRIVQAAIEKIRSEAEEGEYLASLSISTPNSDEHAWKATSVHLAIDIVVEPELAGTPRPDLLDPWIE